MNLERIREELRRLSALVDGWSDEGRIAALERDLALEKLRMLYETLRFDTEPVAVREPAEPAAAAMPVNLDLDDDILSLDADLPDHGWAEGMTDGGAPEPMMEVVPESVTVAESVATELVAAPEPVVEVAPGPVAAAEPVAAVAAEPAAVPAPEPAARPVEATLFDLEGTVSHRRRQRVILSLYGAAGAEMPAPKPQPAAVPAESAAPEVAEPAAPAVAEPAVVAEPEPVDPVSVEPSSVAPAESVEPEPGVPVTAEPGAPVTAEPGADAVPAADPEFVAEEPSDADPVPFVEESVRAGEESVAEVPEAVVETAVEAGEAIPVEPEPAVVAEAVAPVQPEPVPEMEPEPAPETYFEPVAAPFAVDEAAPAPVLGEVINHDVQTLADTIGPPRDMASELRRLEPVTDLERAIGLNDKFLLIRDLFGGDAEAYDRALKTFNGFDDLDDCMIYIAENYAWNPNSDGAKLLMELLERKFV